MGQREVVDGRRTPARCGPTRSRPVVVSGKVPILVRCCCKRNPTVPLAVPDPRTRSRSRSTGNRDVSEVYVGHADGSAGQGAGSAEGVRPDKMPHRGVGASGERQGSGNGLVGGRGDDLQATRGDAGDG